MAETNNNAQVGSDNAVPQKDKKKRFKGKPKKKTDNYVPDAPAEVLSVTIEDLNLPEKTYNALVVGEVLTVGDIIKRRMTEMYKIKNIGKKDCLEIQKRLNKYHVTFRPEEVKEEGAEPNNKNKGNNNTKDKNNNKDTRENGGKKPQPGPKDKKGQPKREREPQEEIDKDELIKFYRKKKWGFKDWQGKEVIPPEFDEAFPFREDLACVEKDEKLGYINKSGELVIPFMYDAALSFSEGLASVTIGDYSGYIDQNGEIVFPFEYDLATSFFDGQALIKKDGKRGFLTKDGNIRWK